MSDYSGSRVVVGLDRGSNNEAVLTAAAVEAHRRSASLVVVHAIEITDRDLEALNVEGMRRRQAAQTDRIETARTDLEQMVGKVVAERGFDVTATYEVRCGDPATCLLAAARHADLIVVGTSGSAHRSPMLLGLVSQDVAVHATCPVLLVPAAT